MNLKDFKMVSVLLIAIALLPLVNGFGVSSDYWDTRPLVLAPGESKEINLALQNMVGDADVTVQAVISDGKAIAELLDNPPVYTVPINREGIYVRVKISIPESAPLDTRYTVAINLNQIGSGKKKGQEMVQLAAGVGTKIPVVVRAQEGAAPPINVPVQEEATRQKSSLSAIIVGIAIIILVILIGYALSKKSKKTKR